MIPRVLVVAASDGSGDGGSAAAVRTIAALGGVASVAITARDTPVERLSPAMVLAQIDAALAEGGVDAVAVGRLGSAEVAHAVAERLGRADARVPLVYDPVMDATGGADADMISAFERLMHRATVITLGPAALDTLGGDAAALARRTGAAVLVTDGPGAGETLADMLVPPHGPPRTWRGPRAGMHHGSGAALAGAIAVGLAAGRPLPIAVEQARAHVGGPLAAPL